MRRAWLMKMMTMLYGLMRSSPTMPLLQGLAVRLARRQKHQKPHHLRRFCYLGRVSVKPITAVICLRLAGRRRRMRTAVTMCIDRVAEAFCRLAGRAATCRCRDTRQM